MLSKLALIGAVAFQAQAAQVFDNEVENLMGDMIEIQDEIEMDQALDAMFMPFLPESMLKIQITQGGKDELEDQAKEIEELSDQYKVSKRMKFKAKYYSEKLKSSQEVADLRKFVENNMPIDANGEWQEDFKPLIAQRLKVKAAAEAMMQHKSVQQFKTANDDDVFGEINIHNKEYDTFDQEVGKLVVERKKFINSKWGKACIEKINALRENKYFEKLEDLWEKQAQTPVHKELVEKVDDMIKSSWELHKFSDTPDSFENGNFMKEFKNFIDMMMHAAEGDAGDFFDWITIQEELKAE